MMIDISVNVLSEFIAAAILALLAWLRVKFIFHLARANPRLPALTFVILAFLLAGVSFIAVLMTSSRIWASGVLVVTWFIFIYFSWRELRQFWDVGVKGADVRIDRGIDYKSALELCHNYLDFLGIGASKLTRLDEFESAVLRCRPDKPVRFLLLSPSDESLSKAARRAGKEKDEYKEVVLSSLRKIADLKRKRDVNIEVRFYKSPPILRLMFIDRYICLASYNIFGEGDGSQLPQLHLMKASEGRREITSFYYPIELYFNRLWDTSETWDFASYL